MPTTSDSLAPGTTATHGWAQRDTTMNHGKSGSGSTAATPTEQHSSYPERWFAGSGLLVSLSEGKTILRVCVI